MSYHRVRFLPMKPQCFLFVDYAEETKSKHFNKCINSFFHFSIVPCNWVRFENPHKKQKWLFLINILYNWSYFHVQYYDLLRLFGHVALRYTETIFLKYLWYSTSFWKEHLEIQESCSKRIYEFHIGTNFILLVYKNIWLSLKIWMKCNGKNSFH